MTNFTEITRDITNVLAANGYDHNSGAINTIVRDWFDAKAALIDILAKHPNWNASKYMIQFDADYARDLDRDAICDFFKYLITQYALDYSIEGECERAKISRLWDVCGNTYLQECDQYYIDALNTYNDAFHFRVGMKSTRVVRKVCDTFGWSSFDDFERHYARYCDAVTPLTIKRHTCLSVNPIDFLYMSHGNSWRSCHAIHDYAGEYSSGTISYMLDDVSLVFYTVDSEYDGDNIECARKIQRQMFMYDAGRLLQSRLYPARNDGDVEKYNAIRAIVQKIFADCENVPNLWKKRNSIPAKKHIDATLYPDWYYSSNGAVYSTLSALVDEDDGGYEMTIGAAPICIECGTRHSYESNISCCDSPYMYCADCGARVHEDDAIYVDGEYYCRDCVAWCDICDSWTRGNAYERYRNGIWSTYCEDCFDEYFIECAHCGDEMHIDDANYTSIGDVCDHCLTHYFAYCDECDEYVLRDDYDAEAEMCNECAAQLDERKDV